MATLTVNIITRAGVAVAESGAAAGGDNFLPGKDTFVQIYNGGGSSITVTFVTPANKIPDVPIADVAVSVPAGAIRLIGSLPSQAFADPTDGLADITYSAVTSVTVAVFKLSQP